IAGPRLNLLLVECASAASRDCAAALLVFPAAATRAGVVASRTGGFRGHDLSASHPRHDVGRRPLVAELFSQKAHVGVDMREEELVTCAKVVQARFAFRSFDESMFGAFAVAGKTDIA